MSDDEDPKYRDLTHMLDDELFYQGIGEDGSFHFLTNMVISKPQARITERYLMAVALTEICYKYGMGMVLYFPMPSMPAKPRLPETAGLIWDACLQAYGRLPALVYVPYVWGPVDKRAWELQSGKGTSVPYSTRRSDRLISLNARTGSIMRKDIVMPVDLTFSLEIPVTHLEAFHTAFPNEQAGFRDIEWLWGDRRWMHGRARYPAQGLSWMAQRFPSAGSTSQRDAEWLV
ncbi:MAG: hypothetical protein Q9176_006562 [Flavoplaca citrina]